MAPLVLRPCSAYHQQRANHVAYRLVTLLMAIIFVQKKLSFIRFNHWQNSSNVKTHLFTIFRRVTQYLSNTSAHYMPTWPLTTRFSGQRSPFQLKETLTSHNMQRCESCQRPWPWHYVMRDISNWPWTTLRKTKITLCYYLNCNNCSEWSPSRTQNKWWCLEKVRDRDMVTADH